MGPAGGGRTASRTGFLGAEALGYEFLAENANLSGRWRDSLAHAATERAIAERIHSRERLAWTYMPTAMSELGLGHPDLAAAAIETGVAIAWAIGERRLAPFLQVYASVAAADLGWLDEALRLAQESLVVADAAGLLFFEPRPAVHSPTCTTRAASGRPPFACAMRCCRSWTAASRQ